MKAHLYQLRAKGAFITADVLRGMKPITGLLSLNERKDYRLGRVVRTARLVDANVPGDVDLVPELMDAQVLGIRGNRLTIAGYERLDNQDFAQSWQIELG